MKIFCFILCTMLLFGCAGVTRSGNAAEVQKIDADALFYFSMAESAIQMNNLPDAILLLKKAEIEDTNNLEIRERLIEVMSMASMYGFVTQEEIIESGENYYSKNKHSAKILRYLAEAYRKSEQFEKADKYLKIALGLEPSQRNYVTYFFFRKTYFGQADTLLLDKALEYPWNSPEELVRIAHFYSEFNLERSLDILRQAYEKWDDLTTLSAMLQYYSESGRGPEIVDLLQDRADRGEDLSVNMLNYLVGFYFNTGRSDMILANSDLCLDSESDQLLRFLFFAALDQEDSQTAIIAGKKLEDLGKVEPEFVNTLKGYMGYSYFKSGQDDKALEYFLETDTIDVILEVFHDLARDSLATQRTIQLLENYRTENDNQDLGNFVSGYINVLLNRDSEARERLALVDFSYLEENALVLPLALTYVEELNDPEKARELLLKRKEPTPSVAEFFAIYYFDSGQDSLAFENITTVMQQEEKPSVSIFLLSSLLAERMSLVRETLPYLERGLELYPDDPEMMNMVGYLIANNEISEKYGLAEDLIKAALVISPDNGMIWDSLAWLYYRRQLYTDALDAMKILLDTPIENSEIAYHLGAIYFRLDNKQEATRYLNMALEIQDDDKAVKGALEILELLKKD